MAGAVNVQRRRSEKARLTMKLKRKEGIDWYSEGTLVDQWIKGSSCTTNRHSLERSLIFYKVQTAKSLPLEGEEIISPFLPYR